MTINATIGAIDWDWYRTEPVPSIPRDFIITTNNNQTISVFSDDVWNFTHNGGPKLFFDNWYGLDMPNTEEELLNETIKQQLKSIMLALISERFLDYIDNISKIDGAYRALKVIGRIALSCGTDLSNLPSNRSFINALKISLFNLASDPETTKDGHLSAHVAKTYLMTAIRDINIIDSRHPDFSFSIVSPEFVSDIEPIIDVISEAHANDTERTMLIPPRIYLEIIERLRTLCDDVERNIEGIIKVSETPDHHLKGRLKKLINENGLETFFEKYAPKPLGFWQKLNQIRQPLYLGLALYSGMRSQEVNHLPFNSLETVNIEGYGEVFLLNGFHRKLQKSKRPTADCWATDINGARIFRNLQVLTKILCIHAFDKWSAKDTPIMSSAKKTENKSALYPEHGLISRKNIANKETREGRLFHIPVTKEDLIALNKFDAARDWSEDIAEGEPWPLKFHQFRRALAVYASRSGIVSLPEMQTQLKHMSKVMTALYAENSVFAELLVKDGRGQLDSSTMGMVLDFRASVSLSKVKTFKNAIDTEHKLTGPAGTKIQRMKDTNTIPHVFKSEDELRKLVQSGALSAKETVLGVCVKDGTCSAYGIDEITPCGPKCPNHIGGIDGTEKLEIYIEELEYSAKEYPSESKYGKALAYEIKQRKIELEEALENEA